ncbi:S8 family serine peptidase [Marilutibacter alkalisoli]|uniref:S8 family serine peptidase n=1 Tax=Marilutibacter alkalisoli TaxID=2591633 RepID=A0A514BNN7_9GAMM|nr:S8 family serine peptidase [Lysobacter alkalisoli]QDH68993.1 S8 family serine peptidase [Lysobacter alkalisoli]
MRNRRHPIRLLAALTLAASTLLAIPAASAQRGPQSLPLQAQLRSLPAERLRTLPASQAALDKVAANALTATRRLELERLVRDHRDAIDTDRAGAPVVRSEIVAIDPSADALQRARAAGFTVASERGLDELGLRIVVLRAREGVGTRAALRRMQRLDPDGQYDYNHLYLGSASTASLPTAAVSSAGGTAGGRHVRVGLVDSGVDGAHPALAGVELQPWGCGGRQHPDRHGTAVASLLAGDTGHGSRAPVTLLAADIYCGQPTGGAATGLAEAMAWLARERVGVINLSLVGPHNRLLERVVQAMSGRGHVLVAAVGNDGPAAPPLYPAAYPEVIGVTAVDARLRALPEAGRGPQVDFAAPGAELRVAIPGGGWDVARGTSFAAPLVARLAAQIVPVANADHGDGVRTVLAAQASDLGTRGRDNTYGHGLVGAAPGFASAGAPR